MKNMIKINRGAINYKILINDDPCIPVTKNGLFVSRNLMFRFSTSWDKCFK